MTIPPVPPQKTTKIGIIGAGASGLTQLAQLLEIWETRPEVKEKSELEVVGFELNEDVGGVWLTNDQSKPNIRTHIPAPTKDGSKEKENRDDLDETFSYSPKGINPSPMYRGLRTNLPHDLMAFRGFPFPEDTPLFPQQDLVQKYLQSYADHYSLRKHVRFSTRVERVYLNQHNQTSTPHGKEDQDEEEEGKKGRRWIIESHDLISDHRKKEEFDYVVVSNGHYSDGWIPPIKGLSTFPGEIIHSRFFHKASDYKGKSVLVVGSFASGGDISRLLASENIKKFSPTGQPFDGHQKEDYIKVTVSSSGYSQYSANDGPWAEYVHHLPLISHLSPPDEGNKKGIIHFEPKESDDENDTNQEEGKITLDDIDVIIFATGYNFMFPFFKSADQPWNHTKLSEKTIRKEERIEGGEIWEEGGLKGQGIDHLDDLLLFLKDDRTISFPTLSYQNVPFPLAQVQTRFTSYLWAGLLPNLPKHIQLPHNPSNPYSQSPTQSEPEEEESPRQDNQDKGSIDPPQPAPETKPRKVLQRIKHLVFGAPYEWTYSEFLMDFMTDSDRQYGVQTPDHWMKVEGWRRDRREDTGLRKRLLGY